MQRVVANQRSRVAACCCCFGMAGTTGTSYVMHRTRMDHESAIEACKQCRPVVDPIGPLRDLLRGLEKAQAAGRP